MSFINIGPAIVDVQYAEFNQDIELNWLIFQLFGNRILGGLFSQIKFRMLTRPSFPILPRLLKMAYHLS